MNVTMLVERQILISTRCSLENEVISDGIWIFSYFPIEICHIFHHHLAKVGIVGFSGIREDFTVNVTMKYQRLIWTLIKG